VWYGHFFSSLPLACSRGVEKKKNSTHAKTGQPKTTILRVMYHTYTCDAHIYTYTTINKSFITNSENPSKSFSPPFPLKSTLLTLNNVSLREPSRKKYRCDRTQSRLSNNPSLFPHHYAFPFARTSGVINSIVEKELLGRYESPLELNCGHVWMILLCAYARLSVIIRLEKEH
jgi:hypothetical protein